MSKKIDPRIVRTRKLLQQALMSLIPEQGYAAITVQDITAQAAINRSTFYTHYTDKDDLLNSIMSEVIEDFASIPRTKPQTESDSAYTQRLYTRIFEHVARHFAFYQVMLGERSVAPFTIQLQAHIESIGLSWIPSRQWQQSQIPPELFISFIGPAFLGLVRWWLKNNMPYPPEVMAEQFMKLTLFGMHREFGITPD